MSRINNYKLINDDFGFLDGEEFDGIKADVFRDLNDMCYEDIRKSNKEDFEQAKRTSKYKCPDPNIHYHYHHHYYYPHPQLYRYVEPNRENIKEINRRRYRDKIREKERRKEIYLISKEKAKYDKIYSKFNAKSNNKKVYFVEEELIVNKKVLKKIANKKTRQYKKPIPCGSHYKKIFHIENQITKMYRNFHYLCY